MSRWDAPPVRNVQIHVSNNGAEPAPVDPSAGVRIPVDTFPGVPTTLSAFGELLTVEPTPRAQIDAVFGIREDTTTITELGGSAAAVDGNFVASTGTTDGGLSRIETHRPIRYHPGQGTSFRLTAIFDTPVADSQQLAGAITHNSGLAFGYNGTSFGVMRRTGGNHEYRTFQVTTPAAGAEDVTITLDGTAMVVAVTAGTAQHNAWELSQADYGYKWDAWSNDDTVHFMQRVHSEPWTGTFSASSTGALAGTFTRVTAGVTPNEYWTPQADWNLDSMDGSGSSGMTLDPAKGNVYEIDMQYLGYGGIEFRVESTTSRQFVAVHRVEYAYTALVPSVNPPILHVGIEARSMGSTTDLSVKSGSMYGGVQGKFLMRTHGHAEIASAAGIGTTFTNVLGVRVREAFRGFHSHQAMFPAILTVAVDGNKPAEVGLYIGAAVTGDVDWQYVEENESIAEWTVSNGTHTPGSGDLTFAVGVGKTAGHVFDLKKLNMSLERGETLCVFVRATSGTTDATVALSWLED